MKCPFCQKDIPDDSGFCNHCGKQIKRCRSCGRTIPDDSEFCPFCGTRIEKVFQEESKQMQRENINPAREVVATSIQSEPISGVSNRSVFSEQGDKPKKKPKILAIAIVAVVILGAIAVCIFVPSVNNYITALFNGGTSDQSISVKELSLSNWRRIDYDDYSETYFADITSEQIEPFVAIFGYYTDGGVSTAFVPMSEGTGTLSAWVYLSNGKGDAYETLNRYEPFGYVRGVALNSDDVEIHYRDLDYVDYDYIKETTCYYHVSFNLNSSASGILICDQTDSSNKIIGRNLTVQIVNGEGKYYLSEDVPYKSRNGVKSTLVPRMFCEAKSVSSSEYSVVKPLEVEKDDSYTYFLVFQGEERLVFPEYNDGFVIYTQEIVSGGKKEDRNDVSNGRTFLHDHECRLSTYYSLDVDEVKNPEKPKYEIQIISYLPIEALDG